MYIIYSCVLTSPTFKCLAAPKQTWKVLRATFSVYREAQICWTTVSQSQYQTYCDNITGCDSVTLITRCTLQVAGLTYVNQSPLYLSQRGTINRSPSKRWWINCHAALCSSTGIKKELEVRDAIPNPIYFSLSLSGSAFGEGCEYFIAAFTTRQRGPIVKHSVTWRLPFVILPPGKRLRGVIPTMVFCPVGICLWSSVMIPEIA